MHEISHPQQPVLEGDDDRLWGGLGTPGRAVTTAVEERLNPQPPEAEPAQANYAQDSADIVAADADQFGLPEGFDQLPAREQVKLIAERFPEGTPMTEEVAQAALDLANTMRPYKDGTESYMVRQLAQGDRKAGVLKVDAGPAERVMNIAARQIPGTPEEVQQVSPLVLGRMVPGVVKDPTVRAAIIERQAAMINDRAAQAREAVKQAKPEPASLGPAATVEVTPPKKTIPELAAAVLEYRRKTDDGSASPEAHAAYDAIEPQLQQLTEGQRIQLEQEMRDLLAVERNAAATKEAVAKPAIDSPGVHVAQSLADTAEAEKRTPRTPEQLAGVMARVSKLIDQGEAAAAQRLHETVINDIDALTWGKRQDYDRELKRQAQAAKAVTSDESFQHEGEDNEYVKGEGPTVLTPPVSTSAEAQQPGKWTPEQIAEIAGISARVRALDNEGRRVEGDKLYNTIHTALNQMTPDEKAAYRKAFKDLIEQQPAPEVFTTPPPEQTTPTFSTPDELKQMTPADIKSIDIDGLSVAQLEERLTDARAALGSAYKDPRAWTAEQHDALKALNENITLKLRKQEAVHIQERLDYVKKRLDLLAEGDVQGLLGNSKQAQRLFGEANIPMGQFFDLTPQGEDEYTRQHNELINTLPIVSDAMVNTMRSYATNALAAQARGEEPDADWAAYDKLYNSLSEKQKRYFKAHSGLEFGQKPPESDRGTESDNPLAPGNPPPEATSTEAPSLPDITTTEAKEVPVTAGKVLYMDDLKDLPKVEYDGKMISRSKWLKMRLKNGRSTEFTFRDADGVTKNAVVFDANGNIVAAPQTYRDQESTRTLKDERVQLDEEDRIKNIPAWNVAARLRRSLDESTERAYNAHPPGEINNKPYTSRRERTRQERIEAGNKLFNDIAGRTLNPEGQEEIDSLKLRLLEEGNGMSQIRLKRLVRRIRKATKDDDNFVN